MAEIVTLQKLKDASVDADTLAGCINGPSNTKVFSRLGRSYWTLATIDFLVENGLIKIEDLQEAIDIAAAAGAGANGWTAQLIIDGNKTQKEINDNQRAIFANILDYGAKPFILDPYSAFNNFNAIQSAIDDLKPGGTLYIPAGKFKSSGNKFIVNKAINVISDGEIFIDASFQNCGFLFSQDPVVVSSDLLSSAPKKGATKLEFTQQPSNLLGICDHFVRISSTEKMYAVPLTGGVQYYYKNDNIRLIKDDFTLMYPVLFDYEDKSKINLSFYKFRDRTSLQFKIVLFNVASSTIVSSLVKFFGISNIELDYSFKIHESIRSITGVGVYCENSSDITLKSVNSSIFSKSVTSGSSYEFLNICSSNVYFNGINPVQAEIIRHWYVARHGRNVHFDKCNIALDDHFGHDYYISNANLPRGVTFCGGSITFTNVSSYAGYLLSLRADAPYADGALTFNNCKTASLLYIPAGQLGEHEGFVNKYKAWDRIIINNITGRIENTFAFFQLNPPTPTYSFEPIKRIEFNTGTVTVPDGYKGSFAPLLDAISQSSHALVKKLIINNVEYEIEGTQEFVGSNRNMPIRRLSAEKIILNNCFGLSFAGCKANEVHVNGGSYGVPDNGELQTTFTDLNELTLNQGVDVYINDNLFSNLARSFSLSSEIANVRKNIFINNSRIHASFINNVQEAGFLKKTTGNYVKSGNAWASYDIKNYYADSIRGERFARFSTTLAAIAPGSTSTIQTVTLMRVRLDQNEKIVGAFNVNARGLRIVAWVSAADTVSYYVENPSGNPGGTVILGIVSIFLKTV